MAYWKLEILPNGTAIQRSSNALTSRSAHEGIWKSGDGLFMRSCHMSIKRSFDGLT